MGEPLFHPRIIDMVRAASALGRRTELISNGSLLTEERSAALLDAGLDMLWLSVDSLKEENYAAIRCNGSLAVLKEHILAFNRLRFAQKREVQLGAAFVLMKSNVSSLAELPFFASYYHVNEVNVSHVVPTSEASAKEALYTGVLQSDLGGEQVPSSAPRIRLPLMDWTAPGVAVSAASLLSAGMCEIYLSESRIRRPARRCRFINEGMPRTDLAVNMLLYMQKHRCIPLGIYDKTAMDSFFDLKRRERLLFSGALRPYDSLEELARKEGLDLAVLKESLDRYNRDIEAGVDKEFGKNIADAKAVPLTKPPFAACTIEPDLSYTQGGVLINTKGEALSALDDEPIPGLYVAGEASAGVFGVTRLTACSLPDCASFGIITGEQVAERARTMKA